MKKYLSISICVPAFNEENSLRRAVEDLVTSLAGLVEKLEIIIVDDASTDATAQLADQLTKEYCQVKVIHHTKQLGIGFCYRDALSVAKGDYFTWFPGDHENSSEEFIQCLPYLKKDTIVTCHHRGQDPRSILRRLISRCYTIILNKYFRLHLKYYNGLSVFPISALRSLSLVANGFLFTAENLIKAIRRGYNVIELSTPLKKRVYGDSSALSLSSICLMARDLSRILLNIGDS